MHGKLPPSTCAASPTSGYLKSEAPVSLLEKHSFLWFLAPYIDRTGVLVVRRMGDPMAGKQIVFRDGRSLRAFGLILVAALIAASFLVSSPLQSSSAKAATAATGGLFVPLQQRLYDTRTTTYAGNTGNQLAAGRWYTVKVAGIGGAPTSGISAVQVTLTEVNATAEGSLKADATGVASPNTSVPALLWTDGKESNAATIPVGSDGNFQIYVSAATDITIDLQGYYTSGSTAAGGYVPGTNKKILGSSSTSYSKGQTLTLQVAGTEQVPADASAVMLSILVIPTDTTAGNLLVYPAGTPPSTPWLLNWSSSENSVFTSAVGLNSSGKVTIAIQNGSTALQVAVQGYFVPGTSGDKAGSFTTTRSRVIDTRTGTALAAKETRTFKISNTQGLPSVADGLSSVAANLVIYPGTTSGAKGSVLMSASDEPENFWTQFVYPGEKVSAFSVTKVGNGGSVKVHNSTGTPIDVVLDVEGWFQGNLRPTVSCPGYSDGSTSATVPSQAVSCSVTAPATGESGAQLQVSADGQVATPTTLRSTSATTVSVSVPSSGGTHSLEASVTSNNADPNFTVYSFGLGQTDAGSTTTDPDTGTTTISAPSIATATPAADTGDESGFWNSSYLAGAVADDEAPAPANPDDDPDTSGFDNSPAVTPDASGTSSSDAVNAEGDTDASSGTSTASGSPAKAVAGTAPKMAGKLTFVEGGSTHSCSATAVNNGHKNLVETAGHCVYDAKYGQHTNFAFTPRYKNGSGPYGTWSYVSSYVLPQWKNDNNHNYDQAFLTFRKKSKALVDTVGGASFIYSAGQQQRNIVVWGWPADPPYNGTQSYYCAGSSSLRRPFSPDAIVTCDMTGGASGGPWFKSDGKSLYAVTSRISYGHTAVIASPNSDKLNDLFKKLNK